MKVTSIIQGNDGNIWIGTEGHGLYCWHKGEGEGLAALEFIAFDGLVITAVLPASENILWVGTGLGLYQYDLTESSFIHFTEGNGALPRVFNIWHFQ